jgi:hypothetical protein
MDKSLYKRIAELEAYQLSSAEICRIVRITQGELDAIRASEEYAEVYSRVAGDQIQMQHETNTTWDAVEALALSNVVNELRYNNDGEFALRAAKVANQALRRGRMNEVRTATVQNGVQAFISLPTVFIESLNAIAVNNVAENPQITNAKGNAMLVGQKTRDVYDVSKLAKDAGMSVGVKDLVHLNDMLLTDSKEGALIEADAIVKETSDG